MTGRHDYPELADAKPAPVEQVRCRYCGGSGWHETHVDELGGHGWRCWNCGGSGWIWVEASDAS